MSTRDPSASPQPARLTCPACGAGLDLDELRRSDGTHLECAYCGSTVALPGARPPDAAAGSTPSDRPPARPARPVTDGVMIRSGRRWPVLLVVLLIGLAMVGTGLWRSGLLPRGDGGNAEVALEFGGEGTGPGLMDDPRLIAVDGDGHIWVADYEDGRLQEFDAAGRFVRVIQVARKPGGAKYPSGLAADAEGHVYVARGGDILVYATSTGALQRTIPGSYGDLAFDDVAVDANGTLYALQSAATSNILVVLDSAGRVTRRWDRIVTAVHPDEVGMGMRLAVDGLGQFFISSSFGNQVYRFGADARFIDRFGSEGDQPGQLNSPRAIAVDGQGRVHVQQFLGAVDQFDASGRFLGRITTDHRRGTAMAMTVDRSGHLYVVTNAGKVVKYRMRPVPTS